MSERSQRKVSMLLCCIVGWVVAILMFVVAIYAITTRPSAGRLFSVVHSKRASTSDKVAALCGIGALRDAKSATELVGLLKSDDVVIRASAATALIAIGKPAVPELIKLIEAAQQMPIISTADMIPMGAPESAAAYALVGIGKDALLELMRMLQSKEHRIWYSAAQIISRIGKDALPMLTKAFTETKDTAYSNNIAFTIGLMGDVAERALIDTYRAVSDQIKRVQLLSQFGSIKNPSKDTLELLFKAAEDSTTASTALSALGQTRHPEAIRFLVSKLKSEDPLIRSNAAVALGIAGAKEAVPQLIELLKDEKAAVGAANALGALRDTRAVKPLIELLRKKTPASMHAAYALSSLGAREAVSALAATLKEVKGSKEHVSLRIACIIALGQLRATEAKPVIEEMLNDPDQMVREHAKRVLDELSR